MITKPANHDECIPLRAAVVQTAVSPEEDLRPTGLMLSGCLPQSRSDVRGAETHLIALIE